jgi:hypothetical protein
LQGLLPFQWTKSVALAIVEACSSAKSHNIYQINLFGGGREGRKKSAILCQKAIQEISKVEFPI